MTENLPAIIERPEPPVPADADLRSYEWFPLYHKRLRRSAFWINASDQTRAISVEFWCEAYEQVPASSLPNDDVFLAQLAGFGRRDVAGWMAVKDDVMSAWTMCNDGRWYHGTLAEVVLKALEVRTKEAQRKAEYRAKRLPAGEKSPTGHANSSHGTDAEGTGTGRGRPGVKSAQDNDRDSDTTGTKKKKEREGSPQRGSRLPKDWSPDPFQHAEALNEGFTAAQTERMALTFRDYWIAQPGQRGVRTDWGAVWRNWLRREAEKRPPASTTSVDGWVPFQ